MAAAPPSLGTHFREELSCSICLELFTRPKVLPCQHTFCQDCLQDHAGRGGTFQCPICRRQVRLPPQGVAGLPDGHIIANLCERLQQQTTLSGETRQQPQSANRCSFHPFEELKVYCTQCQVRVCDQCLEGSHDGHGTTSIKKAAQERSSTVQPVINEGRNIVESYLSFLRSLREEEKTLNKKKQQTENSILQSYNQTVQKLTERTNHLLSESGESHTKNLARIQTERDRVLADINELSVACDRAEQELQQGWVEFLSLQTALTEVVGKYRGKAAPIPVQSQPAVFQPTDTPVPVLGHVTVQSLPSAARGTGHHHGNQRQGAHQPQKVTFGGKGSGTGQFWGPCGVTVSDEGEIFVVDGWNQRIQVFTLQGTFVRQFPTVLSGGQKIEPTNVAMDGEGNLWVVGETDSDNFAVQYNKQGRVLRKFDLQKTGWVRGVAVDTRRNHILITQTTGVEDNRQGELQVFRRDGTLVRTVGQQQGMKCPRYITVDGEGNILMSDWGNHCVYVYNEDGQFLFQFGGRGSGEGDLKHPLGICTDRAGNIIVADRGNRRVEMFDKTGKFLKHITTDMERPHAVAMATQGQPVVTDGRDHSVSIFQHLKPEKVTFGEKGSGTGQFDCPCGVTVSDEGEIFVADTWKQRIQVFTLQGTFVRQFPTVVSGGQKMYPYDVAMDGEGNLWVVGDTYSANFAVQYNKQGRVLRKFGLQKTGRVRGVAVDTRRNLILITQTTWDWSNLHGEIQVFWPDGTLVGTVGQQQGMKFPRYITVDGEGNILVSDWGNHCVYVYNEDGQFLFQFGGEGSGEGQLDHPRGIRTDRAGNIIVADFRNNRVEMFDKTGKFLKHITTVMKGPLAVAMATQGQLVVTDRVDNIVCICICISSITALQRNTPALQASSAAAAGYITPNDLLYLTFERLTLDIV